MRLLITIAALVLVASVVSCGRQTSRSREARSTLDGGGSQGILAVINGETITVAQFTNEWARRWLGSRGQETTLDAKQALLDQMIRFNVLAQKARAAGYDRDPILRGRFEQMMVEKYQEDQLAKIPNRAQRLDNSQLTGQAAPLADAETEARDYYERNLARYSVPESAHVAIIYFKSSPKAAIELRNKLKTDAEAVLREAREADAVKFADLARKHSDDQATRYTGGDLGWLERNKKTHFLDPELEKAAFALQQPGECAPLVETSNGFYVVRLLERRAAGVRPFSEVREVVMYEATRELEQRKQAAFTKEILHGMSIRTNLALLSTLGGPGPQQNEPPPRLPTAAQSPSAEHLDHSQLSSPN